MSKNRMRCTRIAASALTLSVMMTMLGSCAENGAADGQAAPGSATPVSGQTALVATGETLSKKETVYVLCDAAGDVSKVIVSDWLKNGTGENAVRDTTGLSDVEVVKGDTRYTLDADHMTVWDAKGGDVYYQGTSAQELPVTVSVSYRLDGQPISAEALAGKSGRVAIRFDYDNTRYEEVEIDGVRTKIYVPFAMLTGVLLDGRTFSNVEVSNGKLIELGDRKIAVGFAFPGLQEDLDIDRQDFEIPDSVEITADVTDFSLGNTLTLATNSIWEDIDTSKMDSLEGLTDSMTALSNSMSRLIDGSSSLYGYLGQLLEKSNVMVGAIGQLASASAKLSEGASSIYDGSVSLRDNLVRLKSGLDTLTANNDQLNGGAKTVFDTLLAAANQQLAAAGLEQLGVTAPTLTMENYDAALQGLITDLGADQAVQAAYAEALTQVTAAVQAQKDDVYLAAAQLAVKRTLMSQGQTGEAADAYLQTGEGQALVAGAVAAMSEEQKAAAVQAVIDQKMESEPVVSQISAAVSAASAGAAKLVELKGQLDQYNTFYQGLVAYTAGVSDARDAAAQLSAGAGTLTGYVEELAGRLDELDQATAKLSRESSALPGAAAQLRDGSLQLSDGLRELNEQGIQKLVGLVQNDLGAFTVRLKAVCAVSGEYNNFSGIADGMDGSVKFIFKTGEIG